MYLVKEKDIYYPLLTKRSTAPNLEVIRLKSVKFRRVNDNTSFYTVILKMWPFTIPSPCYWHNYDDLEIQLSKKYSIFHEW